jgi:hypothetical protein
MKKIKLENEEYFTYSSSTNDLESAGELTGDYILSRHIKCENFQVVICSETFGMYLISRQL